MPPLASFQDLSNAGIAPRNGSRSSRSTSSGVLMVRSKNSTRGRQHHSRHQAKHQPERQIERHVGRRRQRRHMPAIDDVDVGRLQSGRDIGLFQALEQTFVQLPVGLDLPLENVEFDRVLRQLVGQTILAARAAASRSRCATARLYSTLACSSAFRFSFASC